MNIWFLIELSLYQLASGPNRLMPVFKVACLKLDYLRLIRQSEQGQLLLLKLPNPNKVLNKQIPSVKRRGYLLC